MATRADRAALIITTLGMLAADYWGWMRFQPVAILVISCGSVYAGLVYDRALVKAAQHEGYRLALRDILATAHEKQAVQLNAEEEKG